MTTRIEPAAGKDAASSEDLLRAAVSGPKPAATAATPLRRRRDRVSMGALGGGLALGILVGAVTAHVAAARPGHADLVLADMATGLEAQRFGNAKLAADLERLGTAVAALKDAGDGARDAAKTRGADLAGAMSRAEQGLAAKIAALGERLDQLDREQAARIAALGSQMEKRAAVVVAPKADPMVTGSLPEAKPKPPVIEGWAVRDVYAGTAMLEDRRRRLLEVAAGDSIPGIGRVESVERRGRDWVVVTRQGVVTPQSW